MDSIICDSHHTCQRCNWAVGFALEPDGSGRNINARFRLITVSGGPEQVCDAAAASGGPLLLLKVSFRRNVDQTCLFLRHKLSDALAAAHKKAAAGPAAK